MEGLIELVAASFVRHGIECPASESNAVWRRATSSTQATTSPSESTALLEHSFRKNSEDDPAP